MRANSSILARTSRAGHVQNFEKKIEPAAPAIPRRSPIQVLGRPDTG